MAEQGFARRMMAQRLMTEKRDDPFSGSRFFNAGSTPDQFVRELPDPVDASLAREGANLADVAYGTAATGTLFAPGAGVADVFGYAPDPFNRGEFLPSFGENIAAGNYLDAGLQTLGVAGDVMMAGGAFVPPLVGVGAALKAPRAARVAGQAGDVAADVAKVDPNQQMGDALAQAQARYFETGNFEPPTAENPVSVVLPTETEPGIIAFHGSGADFDEFRLEMIGTGEGSQAFGYGLYFTDSEGIAKFYKDALGSENLVLPSGQTVRTMNIGDMAVVEDALPSELERLGVINQAPDGTARYNKPSVLIAEAISEAGSDDLVGNTRKYLETKLETESSFERQRLGFTKAEGDALEQANINALAAFDKMIEAGIETKTGKMYKVALSPKPDELLDYDLDIARMPKEMRAKIEAAARRAIEMSRDPEINGLDPYDPEMQPTVGALLGDFTGRRPSETGFSGGRFADLPVAGLLSDLEDMVGTRLSTKLLNDEGIPGLKYRASGSRSPNVKDEDAKRNYVIFDDNAVRILEKYGIAGPVLVTGGAVAATQRGGDEEGSIFPDA